MLRLAVSAALLASAASARYYLLHPQGQSQYCLAIDPCAGGAEREYPLVTAECDGSDEQKWGTRLIGDTETITWHTLAFPDRCINGNTTSDPPKTGQQVRLAACTPDRYNMWQDWARDGNQLIAGSLDETLFALDRKDGAIPGVVQLWPWVEWNSNQVWDFDLHEDE